MSSNVFPETDEETGNYYVTPHFEDPRYTRLVTQFSNSD